MLYFIRPLRALGFCTVAGKTFAFLRCEDIEVRGIVEGHVVGRRAGEG